jgi:hypothetical protein
MLKLKLVKLPVFAATVSVSVAATTKPAGKEVPSMFQVKVKDELADDGFQSEVAMLSVSGVLPVFFT